MQLKSTFARSLSRKWNTLYSSLITTYLSYNNIRNERFFKKKKEEKKERNVNSSDTKIKITSLLATILSSYVISYIKSIIKNVRGYGFKNIVQR